MHVHLVITDLLWNSICVNFPTSRVVQTNIFTVPHFHYVICVPNSDHGILKNVYVLYIPNSDHGILKNVHVLYVPNSNHGILKMYMYCMFQIVIMEY